MPLVEDSLKGLQKLVRLPPAAVPAKFVHTGRIPDDLATDEATGLHLSGDEAAALEDLQALLPGDLRFEYMERREREDAMWRFVCLASLQRKEGHVDGFIARYAREPEQLTCFYPVLHLAVAEDLLFQNARLIPIAEAHRSAIVGPDRHPSMASVIAVECEGTNRSAMSERAAEVARHALRLLRAGLRESHSVVDRQLRFRLGSAYWFSDGLSGFKVGPEEGWGFELDLAGLESVAALPVAALPLTGGTEVERCARRALEWFEQSQLAVDPLMEILLLTFALETILGRKSEKLKGRQLAIRRAVLSHRTRGNFAHPLRFYLVYDEIRSVAVHGGEPPLVDDDLVQTVAWDVRGAINEFLKFARCGGYVKRGRILTALDNDRDATEIAQQFLPLPGGEPEPG
ncbi:MAG: hypothetical protein WBQ21_01410 [Solirubrobacteraceae bacterium]